TPALQPYWGANRPFLTADVDGAVQPETPPAYSVEESSICYQRALEVYNVVNSLTPDQKAIAEFWSDDPVTTATPPGHSISILNQIIKEKDLDLSVSVEAFAKLGIGISDAFISCWKVKYETLYPRPITYINAHIDPDWKPILSTPPFPEYTSGHSVQSGALAEIMTDFFGESYAFKDRTHETRTDMDGTPRSFNNFYELAEEAAISRLYGGIHFKEAIELGLQQGYQIGKNVNALNLDK
uniref:vanadium-dependent haloperoxidase n=1 Tax=Pricia sp. TaxID=2268138 RepID=UPI0035934845